MNIETPEKASYTSPDPSIKNPCYSLFLRLFRNHKRKINPKQDPPETLEKPSHSHTNSIELLNIPKVGPFSTSEPPENNQLNNYRISKSSDQKKFPSISENLYGIQKYSLSDIKSKSKTPSKSTIATEKSIPASSAGTTSEIFQLQLREDSDKSLIWSNKSNTPSSIRSLVQSNWIKRFHGLLQYYSKINDNFRDKEFPPVMSSITDDDTHIHFAKFQNAVWLRPHQFMNVDYDSIYLFDVIDPNDIEQGILGVCYFLASLSALAEFPARITKIFNNNESNRYGIYSVNIFVQGISTEIVVDDYFPCDSATRKPLFSRPNGNELWVLILEKAWAKIYGNYVCTELGHASQALSDLLGAPSEDFITEKLEENEVWELLYESYCQNYFMVAATFGDVKETDGLVASHSYTIVGVYDVEDYRLVKLRNPWGGFEWNGDFCDTSSLWTNKIQAKVGHTNKNDGIFFMKLEDFRRYFETFSMCYYKEDWYNNYIHVDTQEKHADYVEILLQKRADVCVRVHLLDERLVEDSNYKYSAYEYILCRVEDSGYKVLDYGETNNIACDRVHAAVFLKLDAGKYVLRLKMSSSTPVANSMYVVSTYSDGHIKLRIGKKHEYKDFMKQVLMRVGRFCGDKEKDYNHCYLTRGTLFNLTFLMFQNKHPTLTWTTKVEFTRVSNLRMGKQFKLKNGKMKVKVPPGKSELVYMKMLEVETECSFDYVLNSVWQ